MIVLLPAIAQFVECLSVKREEANSFSVVVNPVYVLCYYIKSKVSNRQNVGSWYTIIISELFATV